MTAANWVGKIEEQIEKFSRTYGAVYAVSERVLSASFEVGCLLLLSNDYAKRGTLTVQNLANDGSYRYLTTPSGNPNNFSWIALTMEGRNYEIRQQVRIKSYLDPDIAFSPDIVVLKENATIEGVRDRDFANAKRPFYSTTSDWVIAAHECKSLTPFPELLVSFIGMLIAAHSWFSNSTFRIATEGDRHLAPSLFVGGSTNPIQRRMVAALERVYPVNVFTGLHDTEWRMIRGGANLRYISVENALLDAGEWEAYEPSAEEWAWYHSQRADLTW